LAKSNKSPPDTSSMVYFDIYIDSFLKIRKTRYAQTVPNFCKNLIDRYTKFSITEENSKKFNERNSMNLKSTPTVYDLSQKFKFLLVLSCICLFRWVIHLGIPEVFFVESCILNLAFWIIFFAFRTSSVRFRFALLWESLHFLFFPHSTCQMSLHCSIFFSLHTRLLRAQILSSPSDPNMPDYGRIHIMVEPNSRAHSDAIRSIQNSPWFPRTHSASHLLW